MAVLETTPAVEAQPLQRLAKQHTTRRVAFWNRRTGQLISDMSAHGVTLPADAPLSHVLNLICHTNPAFRVRSLFIVGGETVETTPRRSWWAEPVAHGWRYDGYELAAHSAGGEEAHENAGSYSVGEGAATVRVDVRMSALWFPGVEDAEAARDAWTVLRRALGLAFDEHATLLATPAMTGLDLLRRSLPSRVTYPLAPQELRDLLYRISGQGRFEWCPTEALVGAVVPGLYTLDARWMYAACMRGLPVGIPERTEYPSGADPLQAYIDYAPGWYRVNIKVPGQWRHAGLIGQRITAIEETVYPDMPGQWIRDVWTTGAELALALRAGWACLIYERWVYDRVSSSKVVDPTRTWVSKLRNLRAQYSDSPAIAGAIRHLAIDTVGMWHRQAGEKLRITPIKQFPGSDFGRLHHLDRKAGLAYWYEPQPLGREAQMWQRPEWSATVWGRARARLNTAAMRVPRTQLVAYRADALVTCVEPPAEVWADDGEPGTFRRKGDLVGPLVMPGSAGEYLQLRRDAAKIDKGE